MTLPYSQGQTEGQVNKLKLVKRSMYGRGKFDLLRQRVLYAASWKTKVAEPEASGFASSDSRKNRLTGGSPPLRPRWASLVTSLTPRRPR